MGKPSHHFTKSHRYLQFAVFLMVIVNWIGGSSAVTDKAEQKKITLYHQLAAEVRNSRGSPDFQTRVSQFMEGLSETELLHFTQGITDQNEMMAAYQVAGKELGRRIKAGMSAAPLISQAKNKSEPAEVRILALLALDASCGSLSTTGKMDVFNSAKIIAADRMERQMQVRLSALITANSAVSDLYYQQAIGHGQVTAYAADLQNLMQDKNEDAQLRRGAIKGLALLRYEPAAVAIAELIKDPENINNAPIARSACVALANLDYKAAIDDIGRVLSATEDSYIHGSASYALGELGTIQGLELLVQNAGRFDNGVGGAAICKQHKLIMEILSDLQSPHLLTAVKASGYLFKNEHIEACRKKLSALLDYDLSDDVVKEILSRFWDIGTQEDFQQIVKRVSPRPEFEELWKRIYHRSEAMPVESTPVGENPDSTAYSSPAPLLAEYGNTTGQEYGDAIYRENDLGPLSGLDHAAMFAGINKNDTLKIIEVSGVSAVVKYNDLSSMTNNPDRTYWGAYNLSNTSLTFEDRVAIVRTATYLIGADIGYAPIAFPTQNCLHYASGTTDPIDPAEIEDLRCDGLVEYCYEYNGFNVWGKNGQDYSISASKSNCDKHNTLYIGCWPDDDPDTDLAPVVQRGGAGGTSTYMTADANVGSPTLDITLWKDCGQTEVYITATDKSGIHKIEYRIGTGNWQTAFTESVGDGNSYPTYGKTIELDIKQPCQLYYFAIDNGGNASSVFSIWVDVRAAVPPSPPSMASVSTDQTDKVHINWNPSDPNKAVIGYRPCCSDSANGPWWALTTSWLPSSTLSYDDTTAVPGKTYYYAVEAKNSCGSSGIGSSIAGWRKLSPPTGVAASDGTYTASITITWSSATGASYYRVYRSDGQTEVPIDSWEQGTTCYDYPTPGVTYYYRVKAATASDGSHPSDFSSSDSGWGKMSFVGWVGATHGTSADYVRVMWDSVLGATHYNLYRADNPSEANASSLSGWQTATNYDDTSAEPNKLYYYWVKAAVDIAGSRATNYSVHAYGWRATTTPTDTNAPTPDPMNWSQKPTADGTSSVSMDANSATDASPPVQYQFGFTGPTAGIGGTDSGWQGSTHYCDDGLIANEEYCYKVWARDSTASHYYTGWSSEECAYTNIETPTTVTFTGVTTTSISVKINTNLSTLSHIECGNSAVQIFDINNSTSSGWFQDCNTSWTNDSLSVNTMYGFRAKARNIVGQETGYSCIEYAYTLANAPQAALLSNITMISIRANWGNNGNPANTYYYCENVTTGSGSGWTTNTYWDCDGLMPETTYTFRVIACNGYGIPTNWVSLGDANTLVDNDPPLPNPSTWATVPTSTGSSSITMAVTEACDVCPVQYYFEETSGNFGDTNSGWQTSRTFTDSGLEPNTTYSYRVKARDLSPRKNETSYSNTLSATTGMPKPTTPHLQWSQPPVETDATLEPPVYFGWDAASYTQSPNTLWKVVADDFRCLTSMPITSIHWWGSYSGWSGSNPPNNGGPMSWRIGFWDNVPDPNSGNPREFSHPGQLLWEFDVPSSRVTEQVAGQDSFPYKAIETCFQYNLTMEPNEYFWPDSFESPDKVFWLSIAARYQPWGGYDNPWGWCMRPESWMDNAVGFQVNGPLVPPLALDVNTNSINPISGYDVTFELDTNPNWIATEQAYQTIHHWPHYEAAASCMKQGTSGPEIWQVAADNWKCNHRRPVSAIVWWGSYMDYLYKPGGTYTVPPPGNYQPAYFQISMWTNLAADDPCNTSGFAHPGKKIWEYSASDYNEVLVGYNKGPRQNGDPIPGPREPVFRYSVRLPPGNRFYPNFNGDYWLSIMAGYSVSCPNEYLWGWTNHKRLFADNAVNGTLVSDPCTPEQWQWTQLYAETSQGEDMSFVLFNDVNECISHADYNFDTAVNFTDYQDFADDWQWSGQPDGYNNSDLNCDGLVNFSDLQTFAEQWLNYP